MRNISNKLMQAMENRRDFYASGEITFASGVKKTISKSDLTVSGNSIYDGGGSSSFPLGLLIPRQINLSLDNHDDRWSEYDFYGAKISLQTKYDFDDGTSEEINIGEYTIVTPESYGTVVGITAVDDSYKADKDYSTSLSFPVSLGVALADSCKTCGINLLTATFPNSNYEIPEKPQNLTHRQFIGMCAMIAGGNAKFDEQNRLKIVPYDFSAIENINWLDGGTFAPWSAGDNVDGGTFEPWTSGQNVDGGAFGDRDGIHILYQFAPGIKIEADDVVITGVQMESEDAEGNKTTHLFGKEGYVLSVENQLAKGKESEALALIGAKIVGLRFRPFTGDHIALPTAESMDLAVIIDRKSNVYTTVLTDVDFTYFGFTVMKCTADSPIRNMSVYYGNEAKAVVQARQMVEVEKTQRELAVEALAKQLANGNGLYMTTEPQTGGGNIYYMHDKPSLKESKVVWKLTANAFGISTDGGKTYPYGLDATGVAILERIYAVGINADYITTGTFEIRKGDKVMVLMNKDTGEVILRPDTFELSDGSTIGSIAEDKATAAQNNAKSYTDSKASTTLSDAKSYADSTASSKATAAVNDAMTQQNIFDKLTNGGQTQGIYLEAGRLYINADYIKSGTMTIGGTNNSRGTIKMLDSAGTQSGVWDNHGILIESTDGKTKISPGGIFSIEDASASSGYASYIKLIKKSNGMTSMLTPFGFSIDNNGKSHISMGYTAQGSFLFSASKSGKLLINVSEDSCNFNGSDHYDFGVNGIFYGNTSLSDIGNGTVTGAIRNLQNQVNGKLSTGGGTLSGSLILPNGSVSSTPTGLRFVSSAAICSSGAQHLYFLASSETDYAMQYGVVDSTWALAPYVTAKLRLGTANHEWNAIYAHNSTVQSSDARKKNSIMPISQTYEQVFEQLRPVTYRFNTGDRVHTGFISQDIEKTLNDVGLTAEDWGAFCKDTGEDGEDIYGMRYSEVIALNTHMIQKLMKRVDELEARIQELEGRG